MNTDCIDLSILQIPLISEPHVKMGETHPFWKRAFYDEMPVCLRRLNTKTNIENPICHDHSDFVNNIFNRNAAMNDDSEAKRKSVKTNIPVEVSSNLEECSPQFILRNIPKYEKPYDLSRPLDFNYKDPDKYEAERLIDSVREVKMDPVEYLPCNSTQIVDDFRVFFEEIFSLCPWDKIKRGEPPEDSLWNPKFSMASFTQILLDQRNKLFAVSDEKSTFIDFNKSFTKKSSTPAQSAPAVSPFGPSYGPPSD